MNYNAVISVEDITDESTGDFEEPVSIEEVKDYLRLEGFIDIDESTADDLSDFDFDNRLLAEIIKASRQMIEETAGISILPKTLEAVITNGCGMIEIPFGPVREVTELLDCEGTEIESDNYRVVGNKWKNLQWPCYKNMKITYETGYEKLPMGLKLDVMRLAAYMYENRGDDPTIQKFASQISSKYSRNTGIV